MDPQTVFCPNPECLASGQVGKGNITIHSQKEKRYRCKVCRKTFVETAGTVFYRRKKAPEVITRVLILLAFGCPVQAIVQAFEWDERTVRSLQEQAGQHCEELHEHLVEQPRDLGQVQADEIWVKAQGVILWLAIAMQVSTRLWLGGAVSAHRDQHLIRVEYPGHAERRAASGHPGLLLRPAHRLFAPSRRSMGTPRPPGAGSGLRGDPLRCHPQRSADGQPVRLPHPAGRRCLWQPHRVDHRQRPPRPTPLRQVEFRCRRGQLWHVESVRAGSGGGLPRQIPTCAFWAIGRLEAVNSDRKCVAPKWIKKVSVDIILCQASS